MISKYSPVYLRPSHREIKSSRASKAHVTKNNHISVIKYEKDGTEYIYVKWERQYRKDGGSAVITDSQKFGELGNQI